MPDKIVNHFVLADGSIAKYDAGGLLNLDETVSLAGYAPDAKAVGDRLTDVENLAETLNEGGLELKDEVIAVNVEDWLDAHPEATTTVQDDSLTTAKYKDGSVTTPKLADGAVTYAKLDDSLKAYVTPEMFGAVGDGTTDDTTAVNAAIAEAQNKKKILYFPNNYYVTSAVTILPENDVIMDGAIVYTGSGTALTIGTSATSIINKKFVVNVIGASNYVAGTTGVEFINCYTSSIHIKNVRGFEHGVKVTGDTKAFVYNKVFLYNINNCLFGFELHANNGGWVNENQYFGGRIYVDSGKSFKSSAVGVLLTSNNNYDNNNNTFFCPSVEGLYKGVVVENGTRNEFLNVRTEGVTIPFEADKTHGNFNKFVVGYGVLGTATNISETVNNNERVLDYVNKVVFDSGFLPANSASNDNYAAAARLLYDDQTNERFLTYTYKVVRTDNYLAIPASRHVCAVLNTKGNDLLYVKPVFVNGTTARYRITQYDANGVTIDDAPVARSDEGGTVGFTKSTGSNNRFLNGSNTSAGLYFRTNENCKKVSIAIVASGTEADLERLIIYSREPLSYYCTANENEPCLNAIPTSAGFVGQIVKNASPTNTGTYAWIYTSTNEWKAITVN